MKNYTIEATKRTPEINFDPVKGLLKIKGRSIPEDSIEFYRPLMESLDLYANSFQPFTTVNIYLEYFCTSSSRCILDVFLKLKTIQEKGGYVTISWYYESDDHDMLEVGEDYQAIVDLAFRMVQMKKMPEMV